MEEEDFTDILDSTVAKKRRMADPELSRKKTKAEQVEGVNLIMDEYKKPGSTKAYFDNQIKKERELKVSDAYTKAFKDRAWNNNQIMNRALNAHRGRSLPLGKDFKDPRKELPDISDL